MTWQDAYAKIIADKALLERFVKDAKAVLTELGVDVSRGTLSEPFELPIPAARGFCGSIGYIGCVSYGE